MKRNAKEEEEKDDDDDEQKKNNVYLYIYTHIIHI